MLAFDEEIICQECGHHVGGIVRSGPAAKSYGDPFDYAIVYVFNGIKAIIKALVSPDKLFGRPYHAVIKSTVASTGREPDWERHKTSP